MRLLDPLVAVLRQGEATGEFPSVRPAEDGSSLLSLTCSLIVDQVVAVHPLSEQELEERVISVAARLVGVSDIPRTRVAAR